ncbi:MAG: ATP synthase F1 subunit epsilon [Candidatus Hydrogenedentota bacterium]
MSDAVTIELCSPTRAPQALQAEKVVLPGAGGVITIMPGHTEFLSQLDTGALIVHEGEEMTFFAVHGGFVEVLDDRILILADQVESASDIDPKRALAAQERAEERILAGKDDTDIPRAEASLSRSLARIQAHTGELY